MIRVEVCESVMEVIWKKVEEGFVTYKSSCDTTLVCGANIYKHNADRSLDKGQGILVPSSAYSEA